MTLSPDATILRWLARRDHVTAPAIGNTCRMTATEVSDSGSKDEAAN